MFKNFYKGTVVKMSHEDISCQSNHTTKNLKDGELLKYLREMSDEYGELVVSVIDGNKLYLTTAHTLKYKEVDNKLDNIKRLIHGYIMGEKE